jgi:hypothetical protein
MARISPAVAKMTLILRIYPHMTFTIHFALESGNSGILFCVTLYIYIEPIAQK